MHIYEYSLKVFSLFIYFRIRGKVNISFGWKNAMYKNIQDILLVSNCFVTNLINVHELIDRQVSSADLYWLEHQWCRPGKLLFGFPSHHNIVFMNKRGEKLHVIVIIIMTSTVLSSCSLVIHVLNCMHNKLLQ